MNNRTTDKNAPHELGRELNIRLTKLVVDLLIAQIKASQIESGNKEFYFSKLTSIDIVVMEQLFHSISEKTTKLEQQYIICFFINMSVKDISILFNITPASVRTARYRIKKKIDKNDAPKFLI